MNTCGTCKHRGKNITQPDYETYGPDRPTTFFLCDRVNFDDEHGRATPTGGKAYVVDGSGYYAALCVETDFGCNLWEGA